MKLFEWYASGEYSLKALTKKAAAVGLTNRTDGSPLVKAKIHQLLLATVLRESQADKEKFGQTALLRLQQQQLLLRSKLDRVYEDRLREAIPDELWSAKSAELQEELRRVRTDMERHETASQA